VSEATNFEGKESLGTPVNQVFAIIDPADRVQEAVQALKEAGIKPDEIGVLNGPSDAEKLDAAIGKEGPLAKLASTGADFGDKDTDYLGEYRKALSEGHAVVAVTAKKGEAREELGEILKLHGARFINSFGRFIIERLES
jgi:hypothetical protein